MKSVRAYAFALLTIAIAVLLTLAIPPAREKSPFLLLTLAVMLSANQGWRVGLFATLLGVASGVYFLIPPLFSFAITGPEDLVPLLLFGAAGIAITSVSHRLKLSQEKIHAANQTLAEAHRRSTAILESISDGFNVIDRGWRYSYVNSASVQILGKSPEELLGKNIWEVWPGAAESSFGAACRRAAAENISVQVEDFYEDLNLWIQARVCPSPEGLSVFFTDVSERKRAEVEMQRLTRTLADRVGELQAILDSAPVAIWIAHDPQCLRITGNAYSYQTIMRAPYDTNVSLSASPESTVVSYKVCRQGVELRPSELPAQIAAASGRPVIAQEYELVFPDGRTVRLLMGAEPLFDASGRVRGSVVTGVDMTELRTAEVRLQHAQKLESIGLLAGGIAHDFNNLLVGVIGNASLAQNMLPQDHPVLEILAHVIKAGDEAAHLTRQMLAYAGKGKFVVEPLDLSRLIPEMSGLVQPSISKKIDLRFNLERNLPVIEADRSQIQQIFMNLVLNAAEAIGDESGVITVKTSSQSVGRRSIKQVEVEELHPGEYVSLKVSDTGCGMDAATRAKIFDPFFSTKFTGRGLGLAAVSGIVRGHSGSITVESTPGKGTNFTILFPTTKKAVAASVSSVASPNLHGSGTILVVDDEEAVRQVVRKTLEHYGYRVLLAKNGGEAIDVFKREPSQISLVILDLSMPGMSGNETLPELRRIRPEVKVLVSSGYTEDETMSLFTGQRVSGFLQKPYVFTRLAEKIRAALE